MRQQAIFDVLTLEELLGFDYSPDLVASDGFSWVCYQHWSCPRKVAEMDTRTKIYIFEIKVLRVLIASPAIGLESVKAKIQALNYSIDALESEMELWTWTAHPKPQLGN